MKQVIRKTIESANKSEKKEQKIRTLLIDMNNIMKMSMVCSKINSSGKDYGMALQTLIQIKQMLNQKDYNFVYAMYDGDNSGVLRYSIYKDYKSNRDKHYDINPFEKSEHYKRIDEYCKRIMDYSRKKRQKVEIKRDETDDESFERQRDIIFSCLEELFIRQVFCDNVEGDDLIAYYVKNKKNNEIVDIMSGDRDLTQLIGEDVNVYIPSMKKFITKENSIKELGYTHENVLIKKIICGDSSDFIKGIKGVGDTTFFKLFPEAVETKLSLDDILVKTKNLIEERAKNKKKPLQSMTNILDRITDGCQGKEIYEINKKIIDLSEPLLTEESIEEMNSIMYAPIDSDGRSFANLYSIIQENEILDLLNENVFSSFFSSFNKLIDNEMKYSK